MTVSSRSRSVAAFTLLELLVVIAIIAVLIGLLLPAVQKVREAAAVITCKNNIKQLGLGMHNADSIHGVLPPGVGFYPGSGPYIPGTAQTYGTGLLHLLPFIEQNGLYEKGRVSGLVQASNNAVFQAPIKIFVCPSDASAMSRGFGIVEDNSNTPWGASSYAGNAQVFCWVNGSGALLSPQGSQSVSRIPDGTSNTILFAEKYARCTNIAIPEGGCFWAYDKTRSNVQPLHPAFAVNWTAYSIGPGSTFRVRPLAGSCDPTLASTPHQVMQVGMVDGSVRSASEGISGLTWWALCTPNWGDLPGSDW